MIGIIGLGYVGSAVYASIKDKTKVLINDIKLENSVPISELEDRCEAIFVCVPTPSDVNGSIDNSIVNEIFNLLDNYKGLIILKSTIIKELIPKKENIVYNPEFLNERSHIEDFKNQKYIVLGGEIFSTSKAEEIYKKYFDLDFDNVKFEHCSIEEASNFKYIRNIYGAYKLLFWEFVHDVTGDSRKMANMLKNIPTSEMDIVGLDGFRGYGGACFPKDIDAFDFEHNHILTKFMKEFNKKLKM